MTWVMTLAQLIYMLTTVTVIIGIWKKELQIQL